MGKRDNFWQIFPVGKLPSRLTFPITQSNLSNVLVEKSHLILN